MSSSVGPPEPSESCVPCASWGQAEPHEKGHADWEEVCDHRSLEALSSRCLSSSSQLRGWNPGVPLCQGPVFPGRAGALAGAVPSCGAVVPPGLRTVPLSGFPPPSCSCFS